MTPPALLSLVAPHQGRQVLAFTRPGDQQAQAFARGLGALWAGDSTEPSPTPLDAAIIFAPVDALVPLALRALRKGGRVDPMIGQGVGGGLVTLAP